MSRRNRIMNVTQFSRQASPLNMDETIISSGLRFTHGILVSHRVSRPVFEFFSYQKRRRVVVVPHPQDAVIVPGKLANVNKNRRNMIIKDINPSVPEKQISVKCLRLIQSPLRRD